MVGFKGRSSIKQYMPMKSTKRGFKIWCLCDSSNGYTYRIMVYTGASTEKESGGLGPAVVLKLANPLLDKSHFLYYDNYFSSVDLAKTLLSHNTYTIATTRSNRKKWPQALKDVKTMSKRLTRGEHCSTSDSSLKNSWAAHGPGNSNRLEIVFEELFWSKRLFADKIRSERTNFTEI